MGVSSSIFFKQWCSGPGIKSTSYRPTNEARYYYSLPFAWSITYPIWAQILQSRTTTVQDPVMFRLFLVKEISKCFPWLIWFAAVILVAAVTVGARKQQVMNVGLFVLIVLWIRSFIWETWFFSNEDTV